MKPDVQSTNEQKTARQTPSDLRKAENAAVPVAQDSTTSPAGLEIARLRDTVAPNQLERLNDALFFLARKYRHSQDGLFALLKDEPPDWVIARAEVELHLYQLSMSMRALHLYHGSDAAVRAAIHGLSEREIIRMAESLD